MCNDLPLLLIIWVRILSTGHKRTGFCYRLYSVPPLDVNGAWLSESRGIEVQLRVSKNQDSARLSRWGSDQCVLLTGQDRRGMHYDALVLRQVASAPAGRGKRGKAVREAQNSHSADFRGRMCPQAEVSLELTSCEHQLFVVFVDVCNLQALDVANHAYCYLISELRSWSVQ
jgi:hypothetical protein